MNFDERETHWEQFLQQKAELVKSFCQDTHCKVCLCLELLKIVVCHNNCFSPEEEKHYLISRLLDGILEEETVTIIKQKFEQHFDNISNSIAAQNKLASLEEILDNCNNEIAKIADVNTQENLKKKNLNIEYDEVASTAYMRKIEDLEQRLLQLEGSLTSLTKENADLKEKIHKASLLYESYMKRRKSEIITEYIQIRDEQEKLRSYLSNIKDQVDKNSENLAKLQREALKPEIRAQLECLSKDFQKYRDLFEQQKSAFDTSCYALKQASNRSQEAVKELDQTRGEIQALKERQNDLRK